MDQLEIRDEPGGVIRDRLDRMGVLDDLRRLPGHERSIVHEALSRAHALDLQTSLGGAKWLTEIADAYEHSPSHRQLVGVLRRAADAHIRL